MDVAKFQLRFSNASRKCTCLWISKEFNTISFGLSDCCKVGNRFYNCRMENPIRHSVLFINSYQDPINWQFQFYPVRKSKVIQSALVPFGSYILKREGLHPVSSRRYRPPPRNTDIIIWYSRIYTPLAIESFELCPSGKLPRIIL